MKKPHPETYGFVYASSPEEESGWTVEGGEEAYYEALEKWAKYNEKVEAAATVDLEPIDKDDDLPF